MIRHMTSSTTLAKKTKQQLDLQIVSSCVCNNMITLENGSSSFNLIDTHTTKKESSVSFLKQHQFKSL